jgi:hypothetical protein
LKLIFNQPAGFSESKPARNRRTQSSSSVGSGTCNPVPSFVLAHSDREQVKARGLGHPQPMPKSNVKWRIRLDVGGVLLGLTAESAVAGSGPPSAPHISSPTTSPLPLAIDATNLGGDHEGSLGESRA